MNEDFDLDKQLYEVSKWPGADGAHYWNTQEDLIQSGLVDDNGLTRIATDNIPHYDLEYLLDRLPDDMHSLQYEVTYRLSMKKIDNTYFLDYSNHAWWRDNKAKFTRAGYDTTDERLAYGIMPVCSTSCRNAAIKLCLELFKQGILKPAGEGA